MNPRTLHSAGLRRLSRAFVAAALIAFFCAAPPAAARPAGIPAEDRGRVLTVIDPLLHDWQILKGAASEGAVLVLRDDRSPVEQIADALSGLRDVRTVNLLSHGSAGTLRFLSGTISASSLDEEQDAWSRIRSNLAPGADLLLYGCDVAAGGAGREFVEKLARVAGADVAASSNPTGELRSGGDWQLEVRQGAIESVPLSVAGYPGLLTVVTFTASDANYDRTSFTRTVGGRTITFSEAGPYDFDMGIDFANGQPGLYAYKGFNFDEVALEISIENGYTFDISSLKYYIQENSLAFELTYGNGTTTSFSNPAISSNWTTLSSFSTPINDVRKVVISTPFFYGVFQDIDITDVKAIAAPPTATTGSASSVSATGATLNGTVNDNGATTTVSFNYGLTASYGTTVAATTGGTVNAGAGSTAVARALTGLTCNTTYHFRVSAVSSGGTTNGSDNTFTTGACVPGAPTIGSATAGDTQASVTFAAPASNGGAAISTYTATSSPGGLTGSCAGPTACEITVTGLTNGTAYTFTVTATNSAGTGAASSASNSVTPKASQTITFNNPGAQDFGTTPTLTASSSSGLIPTFSSSSTGVCTVTSGGALTFVTVGTCTIDADQAGNSTFNAAPTVSRVFAVNAVVPGAPTIGAATGGDTQATVAFTAPASNGGAAITSYTATSNPGGNTGSCAGPAACGITVTGLTNGTAYTFTVTASNSAGTGSASGASNSVTPKASQTITFNNPGAQNYGTTPTLSATSTSGLTPTFSSSTTSVCTITSGGTLDFSDTGTCTIDADQAGNGSFLAAPTVSRSFSVLAVVPDPPSIDDVVPGDGQVVVTFTPPVLDGGAPITVYTATSSPGGITGTCAGPGACSITVVGLTNGTSYQFTVTATNSAGTGNTSAVSTPVTPQAVQTITFNNPGTQTFGTTPTLSATATSGLTPTFSSSTTGVCTITSGGALMFVAAGTCTIDADQEGSVVYQAAATVSRSFTVNAIAPGAPTIGTASPGNTQATVTFTAPASNGGAAITSYTATSSPGGLTGTCAGPGACPITVTGLTNGTAYTFTVTATNSAGTGSPSGASNAVTYDVTAPTVTDGAISLNRTLFKDGDTVTASWNNTAGGDNNNDIASVTVNFTAFGGGAAVAAADSGGTWTASAAVSVPAGGTGLNVAITAVDTNGNPTTTGDTSNAVVDNAAPGLLVGPPSSMLTRQGPVSFAITYSDAAAVTLASGDVTLNATGTAAGTVAVTGTGLTSRTVTISAISGDGTLGITIASGTSSDAAGNAAPSSGPSTAFAADNTAPTVTDARIGLNKTIFRDGESVTATWDNSASGDNNADVASVAVDFSAFGGGAAVVATNTAGVWTATAAASLPAGGTNLNVLVKVIDTAGNETLRADTSNAEIDNTGPILSIGAPSVTLTSSGPVTYALTYSGASTITLPAGSIVAATTGTAQGTVEVAGSGVSARTVTIHSITGNGTIGIQVPSGTASDAAGNLANPAISATFVVSNTAPQPVLTSTEASPSKAPAVPLVVDFGAAVTGFELSDVQVSGGSAGALIDNGGGKFSLTLTPSADGEMVVDIPAGSAQSASGVAAIAAETFRFVSDRTVLVPVVSGFVVGSNSLTGTGEAAAALRISAASSTVCSTAVLSTGLWSCVLPAGQDLFQELTIVQTDPAGNVSGPAHFTLDDGDDVSMTEELAGPHQITDANGNRGADANDDGIVDAFQSNVATMENAAGGTGLSVEIKPVNPETAQPSTCTRFDFVQSLSVGDTLRQGGVVPGDPGFQFPFGLLNYAVRCSSDASNEAMTMAFYFFPGDTLPKESLRADNFVVRKLAAGGAGYTDPRDLGLGITLEEDPALAAKAGVPQVLKMTLLLKDNGAGDDDPVHNTVLDPIGLALPAAGSVSLQMSANKHQVSVGDVLQYQIRVHNATNTALPDIAINNLLPAGFRMVPGSLRLASGSTVSALESTASGRDMRLGSFSIPAKSEVTVAYSVLVGSGAQGVKINAATAVSTLGDASPTATLAVEVIADPIFDRATVLGRVFHDRNGNARMDDGEEGVPGARILTTDGEWIVVDAFGRYNYPGVDAGPNARGSNFILKVDADSLPRGTEFTTGNPRLERITGGAITRIDFGVRLPEAANSATVQDYAAVGTGGRLWVSKSSFERVPRLAVLAPQTLYLDGSGRPSPEAVFWFDSNFSSFVDRWELLFYAGSDEQLSDPLAIVTGGKLPIGSPVPWDGSLRSGRLDDLRSLRYRLKVVDAKGNPGWTLPGTIALAPFSARGPQERASASAPAEVRLRNDIGAFQFALPPGLVTLMGEGLPAGGAVEIEGDVFAVDASGRVTLDRRQEPGPFEWTAVVRDASGSVVTRAPLSGALREEDFSLIGLADLTIGRNDLKGAAELVREDDHFDENVFVDGRVAFYLKGRISGRYLLSAQLDSGEDKVGSLFRNLDGRDPRDLFRRIDPDRYYPVYGDDSRRERDIDSEGKLYVRLDWDKSTVLWGNFNTGFTGTKLAEYNRGLYGAKVDLRTVGATSYGDEKTAVKAFASQPNTSAARDEFEGTGGSLYYLRHQDIVLGSMKLSVEVRETLGNRVRERIDLSQGPDYEIDEFQGRLILTEPLRLTADKHLLTVIRDEALDGDQVVLVAEYEYISDAAFLGDDVTGGIRAKQWLGEHVGIGGTFVREENAAANFEKRAGDVTIRARQNTYVSLEYAETDAGQVVDFGASSDGGLTFAGLEGARSPARSGNAAAMDARLDFADFFGRTVSGKVGAWFRDQDAGFDALTFGSTGTGRQNYGLEGFWDAKAGLRVGARYSHDEAGGYSLETSGVQVDKRLGSGLSLSTEYRHRTGTSSPQLAAPTLFNVVGRDQQGDVVGARLRWRPSDRWSTFLSGQYAVTSPGGSPRNNLFGIGAEYRATGKLNLLGEAFTGGRGNGIRAGAEYNYRKASVAYFNYTTEDTLGLLGGLTLGQRSQLTDKLRIYQEHRFDWQSSDPRKAQVLGMGYSLTGDWTIGAETQRGRARQLGQWFERDAYSVSSHWRNARVSVSNKIELRETDNAVANAAVRERQWVTANRLTFKLSDDVSLLTKLDYAIARGASSDPHLARFGEFDFGAAYRPVKDNRLNMLAMYSYVDNLEPRIAVAASPDRRGLVDDRFHVASVDGVYELTSRWEAGGKLAWKRSGSRADRDSGPFYYSDAKLAIARLRYRFVHRWNGMVEFRSLSVTQSSDSRAGFLSGVGYEFTDNLQGGLGYNFTDFNDDLKTLDFKSHGWFVNMNFKY